MPIAERRVCLCEHTIGEMIEGIAGKHTQSGCACSSLTFAAVTTNWEKPLDPFLVVCGQAYVW